MHHVTKSSTPQRMAWLRRSEVRGQRSSHGLVVLKAGSCSQLNHYRVLFYFCMVYLLWIPDFGNLAVVLFSLGCSTWRTPSHCRFNLVHFACQRNLPISKI